MGFGFKLLGTRGHFEPLRPTWQPGLNLIAAVIEQAVKEVIDPCATSKCAALHYETIHSRRAKYSKISELLKSWKASKLNLFEFAASVGLTHTRLRQDIASLRYYNSYVDEGYSCPREWIFSNSQREWSFIWCLSQLFEEAATIASLIRRHIEDYEKSKHLKIA